MVHYKLTYFEVRGYAEAARQLLTLAGVEFEDIRYNQTDGKWQKDKDSTPFGQLPVLSVDGFEIPQSAAISRYLAKKFGYAGKTPEEQAWADAIVDQFKDFANQFRQLIIAQRAGKSVEEIETIKKDVYIPARESFFKILNGILEKSKSGFLVGDGLTYADLWIADNLYTLAKNDLYNPADEPKLAAFHEKIKSIPVLKEYLEKRPDTQF